MSIRFSAARTTTLLATALLTVTPLVATAPAAADSYPPGERISPGALPRGPATPLLHVEGRTIVGGATRVRVSAAHVSMVGRTGSDYVVLASGADYTRWRLLRVSPSGGRTTVASGDGFQPAVRLSTTGAHAVLALTRRRDAVLRVVETATGDVVRRRTFRSNVNVLDFGRRRMLLSQWADRGTRQRTFWWSPSTDRTAKIADGTGYLADISADRVGVLLGDPYQGACQKVMTISKPRTTLWRSCKDVARAFSPNGRRMVTGYILDDGPGPRVVQVRGARGKVLDTYRSRWFGFLVWESDTRLLLQAAGPRAVAGVRCTLRECERTTKPYATDGRPPWMVMAPWSFPAQ